MKKKAKILIVCFLLLVGAVLYKNPITAEAAYATHELLIDGVNYDASQTSGPLSGDGWSWDNETETLTLSGYNGGPIRSGFDLFYIELAAGTNNIVTNPVGNDNPCIYITQGSYDSDIYIKGSGNLQVINKATTGNANGISTKDVGTIMGFIFLQQTGNISISTANGYGIYSSGQVSFEGSGTTTITGANGIYSVDQCTLSGGSNLVINVDSIGVKIERLANFAVSDRGKVSIHTGTGATIDTRGMISLQNTAGAPCSFVRDSGGNIFENINMFVCYNYYGPIPTGGSFVADKDILRVNGHSYNGTAYEEGFTAPAGEGWSYDKDTKTITLNGYNGSSIYSDEDIFVNLADGTDNVITNTEDDNALRSRRSMTVSGNGNLTINHTSTYVNDWQYGALSVMHGQTAFNIGGKVTVNSNGSGLYVKDMTVVGSGEFEVNAAKNGIVALGNVILGGNAKVTVTGEEESALRYFHNTGVSLTIDGTGHPLTFISAEGSKAIHCQDGTIPPITITNESYYDNITGAPEESKIIYDRIPDPEPEPEPEPIPEPESEDESAGKPPWTGDHHQTVWWVVLMILSSLEIYIFGFYKRTELLRGIGHRDS